MSTQSQILFRRIIPGTDNDRITVFLSGQAWPTEDGKKYDAVQYAILRNDWLNGSISSIDWDEV